ncbi:MAG: YjbQ family protein [Anaerolineaceae bacterium]|nr:YjbQ family protein [Anaerolineaceae bacterium]
MFKTIKINTPPKEILVDITQEVQEYVQTAGIQEGVCILNVPHTTAAITVNSGLDPSTMIDIVDEVHRIVPTRVDFNHTYDTPADASGHIKSSLIGTTASLIIHQGKVLLGGSQSIMFFEFDGPRERKVYIRILADK